MYAKLIVLCTAGFLLAACINTSLYRPAEKSGYGYSEESLGNQQYRVIFFARGGDSDTAYNHALLRAAELGSIDGYSWFRVLNRTEEVSFDNKPQPQPNLFAEPRQHGGNVEQPRFGGPQQKALGNNANPSANNRQRAVMVKLEIQFFDDIPAIKQDNYSTHDTLSLLKHLK